MEGQKADLNASDTDNVQEEPRMKLVFPSNADKKCEGAAAEETSESEGGSFIFPDSSVSSSVDDYYEQQEEDVAVVSDEDVESGEFDYVNAILSQVQNFRQLKIQEKGTEAETNENESGTENAEGSKESQKFPDELSHEFRYDAVLSRSPIVKHYFCCVCGCPAGKDTYTCHMNGHPVCALCQSELNIEQCPFVTKGYSGQLESCQSIVYQYKSVFREFMFDNITVSCAYRSNGCTTKGIWEIIRTHQENCEYANK